MASIDKKRRFDCSGKRAFDDDWEHEYFYREHDQKAMCLICRESVADLKRYNVKRHCDAKHNKCFDGSYVGKDNRMKEFKKRFEFIWARRREYLCLQKLQTMSMKPAIASVTPSLNTRCRFLTQKCSRRLSCPVPTFSSLVFQTRIRSCNRLENCHFHPTHAHVDVMIWVVTLKMTSFGCDSVSLQTSLVT